MHLELGGGVIHKRPPFFLGVGEPRVGAGSGAEASAVLLQLRVHLRLCLQLVDGVEVAHEAEDHDEQQSGHGRDVEVALGLGGGIVGQFRRGFFQSHRVRSLTHPREIPEGGGERNHLWGSIWVRRTSALHSKH